MSETIPEENKKAVPRPVSPPAGGEMEQPEKPVVEVREPEEPKKPPQKKPKDIKAAMERQAGVGEGYPEAPAGTKVTPEKLVWRGQR